MSKKFNKQKEQQIIEMYNKGISQKDIATYFNTFNTSIRRVLLRYNIKIRSNSELFRIVNRDIFSNLDCTETNYWLGMLATDGCVTKKASIVLDLHKNDKYLLEQFIEFTKAPLNLTKTTHYTGIESYRVYFTNYDCVNTLEKYGITRRKSLTLKLNIPFNFHLLRGIFDGDGSISSYFTIASASLNFIKQIEEFLKNNNYHPTTRTVTEYKKGVKRKNPIYIIALHRKDELFKLYYDLYSESYPCLTRKKDKFGSLLQKWDSEKWAKTVEQIQQYRASK